MTKPQRHILFVDDDPLVIRGLKRSAAEFSDEWLTYFAGSGNEALSILAQYPMDVVITDMRMPVMDGNELLENVSQRFPGVIRFVLSGNTENAKVLQLTRLAHQFIAKPCDMEKLKEIVERSCRMRDLLSNPNLLQTTTSIKKLPSLPSIYVHLMKELESEEPTPKIIGDIIAQDVSMTAKILQLVNSAFFGLPGKVTSPQKAVMILGTNTIKALVLSVQVFSEYQGSTYPYFSIDKLWRHSILVGNISRAIAISVGLDAQAQGDAQVAGVLHDLGKLLQLKIPDFFQKVKIANGAVTLESEYQAFGTSHAEIGAYLLGIWGLPEAIVEAIAFHHRPANQAATKFGLIGVIHAANGLYHMESAIEKENYEAYLDLEYLKTAKVVGQLDEWAKLSKNVIHNPRSQ